MHTALFFVLFFPNTDTITFWFRLFASQWALTSTGPFFKEKGWLQLFSKVEPNVCKKIKNKKKSAVCCSVIKSTLARRRKRNLLFMLQFMSKDHLCLSLQGLIRACICVALFFSQSFPLNISLSVFSSKQSECSQMEWTQGKYLAKFACRCLSS